MVNINNTMYTSSFLRRHIAAFQRDTLTYILSLHPFIITFTRFSEIMIWTNIQTNNIIIYILNISIT